MAVKDQKKVRLKNLYPRGDNGILYMKFSYMGKYINRSTKTTDTELALQVIQKVKKEIFEGKNNPPPPKDSITFTKAIEEVYAERWACNRTGLASYRQARFVDSLLENMTVSEIDTKMVRVVYTALKSKIRSESTVNRYMAAFRTVLKHAAESYNLPCPKFRLRKENNGRIRTYSHQEEKQILDCFLIKDLAEMVDITSVLIDTGMRLSECLGIGQRDRSGRLISEVNLSRGCVTSWANKTSKPRTIPLTERAKVILQERGRVPFTYTKNKFEKAWKKMKDALSLEKDCVAHTCRHTFASRLLETGSHLQEVQELLGHTNIQTTMIYSHLQPDKLTAAIARLDAFNFKHKNHA